LFKQHFYFIFVIASHAPTEKSLGLANHIGKNVFASSARHQSAKYNL